MNLLPGFDWLNNQRHEYLIKKFAEEPMGRLERVWGELLQELIVPAFMVPLWLKERQLRKSIEKKLREIRRSRV